MFGNKSRFRTLCLAGAFALGLTGAASAAGMKVVIDQSTPVHLAKPATSIVIGNPAIADVHVQSNQLVFLQGRSFGTTNLVALDADGTEILNIPVTVTAIDQRTVTLQRGTTGRITYACSGRCEQTLMPGDNPEHIKTLLETTMGITGAADQVASAAGGR